MKKNVSLQRRELSAFGLDHQHGRSDVSQCSHQAAALRDSRKKN